MHVGKSFVQFNSVLAPRGVQSCFHGWHANAILVELGFRYCVVGCCPKGVHFPYWRTFPSFRILMLHISLSAFSGVEHGTWLGPSVGPWALPGCEMLVGIVHSTPY